MEVPKVITCVDCGQPAHLLNGSLEHEWEPGDFATYRCSGCGDRWDLVVDDDDFSHAAQTRPDGLEPDFDFRAWLKDRRG